MNVRRKKSFWARHIALGIEEKKKRRAKRNETEKGKGEKKPKNLKVRTRSQQENELLNENQFSRVQRTKYIFLAAWQQMGTTNKHILDVLKERYIFKI